MPWERDIYVQMLMNHLEEEKLKQQQANASNETTNPIVPEGNVFLQKVFARVEI